MKLSKPHHKFTINLLKPIIKNLVQPQTSLLNDTFLKLKPCLKKIKNFRLKMD